ncbi:YchJ family protein [Streptomyces sp. NBC_00878]|uniref:YchJ family protein n=1 Tax=Streptomyces sp. NBC_00878 TaxID=2975854 RepID=UPI002250DEA0|nr:YchJ family metal-binding protein [Streptomyces sp. NBC_00878]MCX4910034.1 YchJ family metal-binding protein [Streptomyces sp. NBC_00878]
MPRRTPQSRNQRHSTPAHNPSCPCGLAETYERCCGRFHGGEGTAPTAEALMRSRYCAFVKRDEAYLLRTWHPRTRPARVEFDPGMRWTGLEILGTGEGTAFHSTGTVTFRASYAGGSLHERSRFERVGGAWVYLTSSPS